MKEYVVTEEIELYEYLRKTLTHMSKNNIKSLLTKEMILVNNSVQKQYNYMLKKKDKITIRDTKIKTNNKDINIIYEDDNYIGINKPAGVFASSIGSERDLQSIVLDYVKTKNKNNRVFLLTKLDKDASGIVIFCKSQQAKNTNRETIFYKSFYAIVDGKMKEKEGTIKEYLFEDSNHIMHKTDNKFKGSLSKIDYVVREENKNYSLLEINEKTDTKNEVRALLKNDNHTIIGDKKYGSNIKVINRLGLHLYKIEFFDKLTNKKIIIKTSVPMLFKKIFK